ncbi:hypothetical protein THRCLA_22607 [Thraustotheca clavata]|uniref:Uncharacterized protein n=1 Tax=Thraustotheca clavata TaxID=74557 RepID=A0A1V9YWD6_9STRA|nr:hypothetical protein THRCLA_22607 [Thraustotheca clavata]
MEDVVAALRTMMLYEEFQVMKCIAYATYACNLNRLKLVFLLCIVLHFVGAMPCVKFESVMFPSNEHNEFKCQEAALDDVAAKTRAKQL